ncbi:MAG: TonB-dependent receptor [Opitutaceae bacterium]|nr:TonB-dependent receptor [Opitutaceae bacterium]
MWKALRIFLSLVSLSAAHVASAQPQSERNGRVTGFVRDAAGGGTLASAVVAVASTGTRTETQADGSFTLFVPPGRHVLTASYTGLERVTATVEVTAGGQTVQNFDLGSPVLKLDQFFVRTVREDDALALQQQRHASNLKTVVATDAYGAPVDNPGELLQRIPGINVNYIDGSLFNVSVRGMGIEFAKVAVDGEGVALSFGNLNSPNRGYNIGSLPTSGLSQVELIRAPTPDQDADAISGTINLVSRRHFDRRPGLQLNASLSGLKRRVAESPNSPDFGEFGSTSLAYNNSFGILGGSKNLGMAVDLAWSKLPSMDAVSGPQQVGTLTDAFVRTASGDYLSRFHSARDTGGPVDKFSATVSFDYKLNESDYVFLRLGVTSQDKNDSRWFARAFGAAANVAAFAPGSTFDNSTVLPTNSTVLSVTSLNSVREARYRRASAGGDIKLFRGSATLSILGAYSSALSRNPYFLNSTAQVSNVGYQIDRRGGNIHQPKLVQTAGPSWSDPANYRIMTLTNTRTTGAPQDSYTLKADLKWRSVDGKFETKTGAVYRRVFTDDLRNPDNWTFVGADGVANSADDSMTNLASDIFRLGRPGYGPFPFLPMVTRKEAIAPAASWRKSATQAYGELTAASARGTEIQEESPAAYAMGTWRVKQVRAVAGVRVEQTDNTFLSWIRNTSASWGGNNVGGASVDPVVVAANIARAERSYVGRQRFKSSYMEVFPGAHLVYEPREGLLLRGSYNRSISRPSILATMPTVSANDETQIVTTGNPELKPYLSDNFELSVERYLNPIGLVSVSGFQKEITRYFRTFTDVVPPEGVDGSGLYAGYERRMARNIGSATIKGVEISAQSQFRNLPGIWSGFGAFANFTYLRARGDFGDIAVTSKLPNMTPRSLNAGVSYVGKSWQVRPLVNWQDRTYRGTSGTTDFDSAARTRIDLKINYAISKRYTLDVSVFNLTDEADNVLISSDRGLPFVEILSGTALNVGVTGRF